MDERVNDPIVDEPSELIPPGAPSFRVLLVEDGLVNRRLAEGFLKRAGHQVTVAEHGAAALRCWEEQPFDIILMDVQMPVMDGFEATTIIRQREAATGRRIPIIAMTAAAMESDRQRCQEVGMDDFLCKPIAPDTLFAMLAKYLQGMAPELVQKEKTSAPAAHENDLREIVDFDTALKQVPGGVELLKELATIFQTECPKLMEDFRQGLADDDVTATQRAAHTLKGAARILAAKQLTQLATEIEQLAKDSHLEAVRSRCDELEAAVEQACRIIKAWHH